MVSCSGLVVVVVVLVNVGPPLAGGGFFVTGYVRLNALRLTGPPGLLLLFAVAALRRWTEAPAGIGCPGSTGAGGCGASCAPNEENGRQSLADI